MKVETLKAVQAARDSRQAVVLAKRIADGAEALVYADRVDGELAQADVIAAARAALTSGRSETVDTSAGKVFLHAFVPPPRMIVVGAVHIAQALVPMAAMTGYDVIVVDPRRAFAADYLFAIVSFMDFVSD
jgi:xanthine dehydrogenase accessory factor